jgi:hypothetical protein
VCNGLSVHQRHHDSVGVLDSRKTGGTHQLLQHSQLDSAHVGYLSRRDIAAVVTHHTVGGQHHWSQRCRYLVHREAAVQQPGDQFSAIVSRIADEPVKESLNAHIGRYVGFRLILATDSHESSRSSSSRGQSPTVTRRDVRLRR